jgi:transposase InsO family protein
LKAQGRAERSVRHQELLRQREADDVWRAERRRQREREGGVARVTAWIAVLVIVDNCTRQCLGVPLFVVGAHVTAELVVEALRALLPAKLQYLIADGGTHFTAAVMQELAKDKGFVRVPLARHRPESNGIAERFVETLKAWLADHEWATDEELRRLLLEFLAYYNDRPHQGYELAGLSPNEYAARLAII